MPAADEGIILPTQGAFDLAQTLDSGQVFHWEAHERDGIPGFAGCLGDRPAWLAQVGPESVRVDG